MSFPAAIFSILDPFPLPSLMSKLSFMVPTSTSSKKWDTHTHTHTHTHSHKEEAYRLKKKTGRKLGKVQNSWDLEKDVDISPSIWTGRKIAIKLGIQ